MEKAHLQEKSGGKRMNKPLRTSRPLLEGIRVIDLSSVLAGPYCTMLLGDLGADIIKVEKPGTGDDTRHWGPPFTSDGRSAYFICVNRNKRSMTLNLKSEGGLKVLRDLIRKGDILIENYRVDTLGNWGLDYDELQNLRPGLIYCTITGYGYSGPYRSRPGYDFMIQAEGGLMSITGPEEGDPYKVGVAITDIMAGLFAANSILAALFSRERSGEGQRIDISLLDAQVAMLANVASNYLVSGKAPMRYGNAHANIVPYQAFKARDQYFALGIGNDLQWAKFCTLVGRPEWVVDDRFKTNAARIEHRAVVVDMLAVLFAHRDAGDWLRELESAGIPAAPINTIDKVFADPHVLEREMRIDLPTSSNGSLPLIGFPMKIPTSPLNVRYEPPFLGQSTDEILSDVLKYDGEQIQLLHTTGVV
jgi:formyl-CoA transferase